MERALNHISLNYFQIGKEIAKEDEQKSYEYFKMQKEYADLLSDIKEQITQKSRVEKQLNREEISNRIKQLRKEKNMTLEEWSALFGSNKSAGSKWENGTIPYKKTLDKMGEISGKSVEWILFGTLN